jgi:hypothetical protein
MRQLPSLRLKANLHDVSSSSVCKPGFRFARLRSS